MNDIINNISVSHSNRLTEKFDLLQDTLQSSTNRLQDSQKFLQSFIEQLNQRYELNLTIHEACLLIQNNLHTLQLPIETQNILLETIAWLTAESLVTKKSQQVATFVNIESLYQGVYWAYWPWEWNWFGLNKNDTQKVKKAIPHLNKSYLQQTISMEEELPGSVYVGGMETLAGALVFTLGLVFPPAYGMGSAMVVDGIRRVLNGMEEIDKTRALNRSME